MFTVQYKTDDMGPVETADFITEKEAFDRGAVEIESGSFEVTVFDSMGNELY